MDMVMALGRFQEGLKIAHVKPRSDVRRIKSTILPTLAQANSWILYARHHNGQRLSLVLLYANLQILVSFGKNLQNVRAPKIAKKL